MGKMTSVQRLMMAFQGKEPDRVPVFGIFLEWAWMQVYGPDSFMDYGLDPERIAKLMVWTCKEMECDMGVAWPDFCITDEAIAEASGMHLPGSRRKDYHVQDCHRLYEGDPIKDMHYGNPLIKTMKDAEKLKPADPYTHGRFPVVLKALELANKELKGEYVMGGICDHPIAIAGKLMGWTQTFMAIQNDIELYKKVEDVIIKTSYEMTKAMIKAGATALFSHTVTPTYMGSDFFFENPVWAQAEDPPQLFKRIFEEFQVGVGLHACSVGPWEQGIPAWKTMLDHIPAFFMAEYGGADALARAKEQLAPATVMGNIHPVDVMLHGSPSDVEEACIELIKKCAPGGRYGLGPGCMLPLDVPFENMKAMIDSAKKYGEYPIRL
ncbi:MAG: hypothetical protein JRJ21_10445 [Deltaproteobacteria bacterium]|nr:hypothetical protein [Deltaproteobacteria bacterium]